jgi:hypothetical protein
MKRTFRTHAALAAALGLAGACERDEVVTRPDWSQTPSEKQMGDSYPLFASLMRTPGAVHMDCLGTAEGRLTDCTVSGVAPTGLGFEAAGLALTPEFRLKPETVNGQAVPKRVTFIIHFTPGEDPPIAPYTGPAPSPEVVEASRRAMEDSMDRWVDDVLAMDLQVDADRRTAATDMLRRALQATQVDRKAVEGLGLARALTPAQQRDVAEGRAPRGPLPTREQILAVSPERVAVAERTEAQLRREYCAAYSCDRPASPPTSD